MKVEHFYNMKDMVKRAEEVENIKFKEKYGFDKTHEMCFASDCPRKAKYILDQNLLIKIKRWFQGNSVCGFIPKYCSKCIRKICKRIKIPFFRSMFVYLLLCNILSLFLGKLFLIVSLMLIPIALLSYYLDGDE